MAELEELLIKVDSELGDLGGIDSAISVLTALKDISDKASKGADSLTKLASAFSTLNKEGKNAQGIQNLKTQIGTLTGILDELANHTKNANKTIKQLSDLGDALTKFAGLSDSLKGLEGISKGVNDMVDVLDRLGGLQGVSKKASQGAKDVTNVAKEMQKATDEMNRASSKKLKKPSNTFAELDEYLYKDFKRGIKSRNEALYNFKKTKEAYAKLYEEEGELSPVRSFISNRQYTKYDKPLTVKFPKIKIENTKENIGSITDAVADMKEAVSGFDAIAQGIENLSKLGESLHSFNGLDDNVKALNSAAMGIRNLIKAVGEADKIDEHSFDFINHIKTALDTLANNSSGYGNIGSATTGLSRLLESLDAVKQIDLSKLDQLKAKMLELNDGEFKTTAHELGNALKNLNDGFSLLEKSHNSVLGDMGIISGGFNKAVEGLYNVREQIEIISEDFDSALSPVLNSRLIEILETFRSMNDSYKNVSGIAQGLGTLLHALLQFQTKGLTVDAQPLYDLLNALKAMAETSLLEEVSAKFEKFQNISDAMARLMNAIKYFAIPLDPNNHSVFDYLKNEIEKFNTDIKGNFDETRNLLYGFKGVFEALQKDTSVVSDDNLFEWLKTEIKELNDVVGEGGNIKVISNLLKGINDIAKIMADGSGLNKKSPLFDNLKSNLTDLYNWSTRSGDMLSSFSKIAGLLNAINTLVASINQGSKLDANNNPIRAIAQSIKDFDSDTITKLGEMKSAFDGITSLAKTIAKLSFLNANLTPQFFKAISEGLLEVNSATEGMAGIEKAINSVNRLISAVDGADKNMTPEDNPLKTIGLGLEKVTSELSQLTGAEKAVNSVSKLVDTVASSDVADTNALSKVAVSLKTIGEIGNAKELGTLASNLNKLVETVSSTKIDARKSSALDKIYSSIKKFDDLKSDKGQLSSLAKDFSKLIGVVAENEDKVGADNVITRLVTSLNGFKNIAENTKGLRGTLNAIGSLIKLASEKVDFGKDNPLSQLKRILGGFSNIVEGTKGLDKVVNSLVKAIDVMKLVNGQDFKIDPVNNPFAVLKAQLDQFVPVTQSLEGLPKVIKALKDFAKEFDATKGLQVDAQPIANLIGAVWYANGAEGAVKNFRDIIKAVGDVSKKGNASLLHEIAVGMSEIARVIVVFSKAGKLQSLVDIANSMVKMKDIELDKFKEMATAIRDIMQALGSFNGNNNTIKINLDERGIINAEREFTNAHRTWQEFRDDVLRDIQTIDFSNMFNMSGSTKELKAELKKAQQELNNALKERQRWQDSMRQTERIKSVEGAQEVEAYRRAYANYWKARKEADQYQASVNRLNAVLSARNGYELENDAEGYRLKKSLADEKKYIEENLKSMRENAPQMSIFGDADEQSEVIDMLERRIKDIDVTTKQIDNELKDGVTNSVEGLQEQVRQLNQEWDEQLNKVKELNKELSSKLGDSMNQFGGAFKNIPILNKSETFGELGNIFSKLGQNISSGKLDLSKLGISQDQLASLSKFAGSFMVIAGKVGTVITLLQKFYKDLGKIQNLLLDFTKKIVSFARTMLSKVVGAFNAVAGAVGKAVSMVRSGAEGISVALRKLGDFGGKVISIFGRLGGALAPALKGLKAIASLITPRIVKTLASSDFNLGQIIKKSRVLSKLMKTATRWFTTMTRMLMRRAITAFLNEMKQAFEDLVVYEKNAGVAMLNLNTNVSKIFSALRRGANQWIAAFEPLINAVTPTILNFLNNVQAWGENVARFMAILTGQPYYIRAKKFYEDYGQSVEDTNKKVKDLTNGLDELNILNDQKDTSSQINPEDMFEYVPINGALGDIQIAVQDILDWIKDKLKSIDWDWLKEEAREWVGKIFDIINTVLRDKEFWQLLGKTVAEIVNFLFTVLNEAVHDLDWKALGRAIAEFIKNALESIDWALIRDTVVTTAKGLADEWNEIFADKELWKDIGKTVAHVINDVIVAYLDTFAWEFNFKNMADSILLAIKVALEGVDWEQIHHMVEGWAQGIVDVFNEFATDSRAWQDVGETLRNTLNEIVHAFDVLGDMDFASAVENLKLAINTMLDFDWESFSEAIDKWVQNISDVINGFLADEEFLTNITTNIGKFADTIITGLSDLIDKIEAYDIGTALSNALRSGLDEIDWETAFTLPSDAINKLSEAIRGMLDSIPEDFNLGTWLAEHLSLTMEGIDWEAIDKNVEDFATNIVNYINGLLADKNFWDNLGSFAGKTFNLIWDLTITPLANVNFDDLISGIETALSKALREIDISEKMGDLGGLTQKIVDAIDRALKRTNWKYIGEQIGAGMSSFILQINPTSIAQTVYDAFVALSDTIGGILTEMLANGGFYRLGAIFANAFYGAITGMAVLVTKNKSEFVKAIEQFTQGITDFIRANKGTIIAALNKIIDGISEILSGVSRQKAELVNELASILERTNLAQLLGTIIGFVLQTWANSTAVKDAIFTSLLKHRDSLFDAVFEQIKPETFAKVIIRALVKGIATLLVQCFTKAALTKIGGLIGSFAGPIGTILGILIGFLLDQLFEHFNLYDMFIDKVESAFSALTGKEKSSKSSTSADDLQKQIDDAMAAFDSLDFGDEEFNPTYTVTPTFEFDDSSMSDWEKYFNERQQGIIIDDPQFGTITASQIEVETLKPWNIDVTEINAEVLNVIDILADKLKVKELEVTGQDEVHTNDMPFMYADNPYGAIGASLSRDSNAETITAKYLVITESVFAPILEVAEKITSPLLEMEEKITAPLAEITEKITSPLLEAEKIFAQLFEALRVNTSYMFASQIETSKIYFGSIAVDSINSQSINTNLINAVDIVASTLRVGTIEGTLSGGTTYPSNTTYPTYPTVYPTYPTGSYTLPNFDWWDGSIYNNIEMPTFAYGERWSDISGLIPSAEDYLNGVDEAFKSLADSSYWTKTDFSLGDTNGNFGVELPISGEDIYEQILNTVQTPTYLGGGSSNATSGTLSKSGVTRLNSFDSKMAEMLAGVQIKDLPSNAEYIRDYLMSFIGNEAGVYGLMGNLYAESGLLPNNLQDITAGEGVTDRDRDYTNKINLLSSTKLKKLNFLDNQGYGLAQWTTSDRKEALLDSLNGRQVNDLDAQLEFLKSELMSSQYSNVLNTLRNASSIEEASDAVLYNFEKPNNMSEATAGIRLAYSQDIAGQLGNYSGDYYEKQPEEEKKDQEGIKNFDEFNVIDTSTTSATNNPLAFLNTLPLQTEYLMAQVYDIIDKWLGRIWKLFRSFKLPQEFLDLFEKLALDDFSGELEIPILAELKRVLENLYYLLSDIAQILKDLIDSLNSLKSSIDILNSSANVLNTTMNRLIDAISGLINRLGDIKAEAHASAESWADSAGNITSAIGSLGDRLNNIKCECTCCGNCSGCNNGGKGTPTGTSIGTPTGTITIPDSPTPTSGNPTGGTSAGGGTNSGTRGTGTSAGGGSGTGTGSSSGKGFMKLVIDGYGDEDGTYPLFVTLDDGQRVQVTKDLPKDIQNRLLAGEGTYDLAGQPLSNFAKYDDNIIQPSQKDHWLAKMPSFFGRGSYNSTSSGNHGTGTRTSDSGIEGTGISGTGNDLGDLFTDTTTHINEPVFGNPNVETADTGTATHDNGTSTDRKSDVNSDTHNTNIAENNSSSSSDDSSQSSDNEEEKKSVGGSTKADVSTGEVWTYDADGNQTGYYDPETKRWSGDNTYTRLQQLADEKKADKAESQRIPDTSTGEIKDGNGNVVGHLDGAWGGKYWIDGKKVSKEEYQKAKSARTTTASFVIDSNGHLVRDENPTSTLPETANAEDLTLDYYTQRQKIASEAMPYYQAALLAKKNDQSQYKTLFTKVQAVYDNLNRNGYTLAQYEKYKEELIKLVKDAGLSPVSSGTTTSSAQVKTSTDNTTADNGTDNLSTIKDFVDNVVSLFNTTKLKSGADIIWGNGTKVSIDPYNKQRNPSTYLKEKNKLQSQVDNNETVTGFAFNKVTATNPVESFDYWYKNSFLVRGYQMGGTPNRGELFVAGEGGKPEFVGSFGSKTVVANNDQIVTAVANGVSMANDRVVNAIESQTGSLETAIDRKNLDVQIGDRQIAEANRRGERGLGNSFVQ